MDFVRSPLVALLASLVAGVVMAFLAAPLLRALGVRPDGALELLSGFAISIAIGFVAGRLITARNGNADSRHRRGAVVSGEQSRTARRPDVSNPDTPVTLAGLPVPLQDETKHFKLIGTTGTGKSTAIREILSGALERGDRAIIADPDGGYLDCFYDPGRGDVILNPFAPGSSKWSLYGEITNDYDVEQLARSLIPDSHDPDSTWIEYSRTFLTAAVQQTSAVGVKDDAELHRLLTRGSSRELDLLLRDTAAGPFLDRGNEKMLSAVRSIITSALRALKYTNRQQGPSFSVRQWVSQGRARSAGGQGGVLFLPYMAGEIAALRSIISAWMRIAIFEAMSRPALDQRLWFAIDELDALGEIDGLKDALARLRKFGGRCILGLQSISQVSATYRNSAQTIVENCGNTVVLRCSASEHGGTSEFASKLIGQREVIHTTQSKTRNPGAWRASTTTSESIKIEPAIMASEIERLPDLQGFLKLASFPDWRRVTFTPPADCAASRGKRPTEPPSTSAATDANPPPAAATPAATPASEAKLPSKSRRPAKSANTVRSRPRKPRTHVQNLTTSPQPGSSPPDTQQPPT
jgi:hypothetical protein